ncbi:MAG: hypothetical protein U0X76_11710 [Bacteroidia bacterium]
MALLTEKQIISILKEREQELKVAGICGKHAKADQTYHNWKKVRLYFGR